MSLTSSLYTSFAGLRHTESQITVSSQNVTNADKPGYTRKEYEAEYGLSGLGSIPVGGTVQIQLFDPFLFETVIEDTSIASNSSVIADYLDRYASRLGTISGGNTLSASLNTLASALDELSVTPEDGALKSQVVSAAEEVAFQLRQLSETIQDIRSDADSEINQSVSNINNSLLKLDELNKEIALTSVTGRSVADLEDERNIELEKLASEIEVDYFFDSQNQLRVYTDGTPLLTSSARTLDFTVASSAIDSTAVYPGGLSGITVNGIDITSDIDGGKLNGLLEIRDTLMVQEQDKLNEFANILSEGMNSLLNTGTSIPARDNIRGDTFGFTLGTALTGTGNVRIAVVNSDNTVSNFADFNLAGYATVNDMITDINATLGPDMAATLGSDGELILAASIAGQGISIAPDTSDMGSGESFSHFFGLNNLFASQAGAEDIQVSEYLQNGSEYLATSGFATGALAIGDVGANAGDGSISKAMNEAFTSAVAFGAAGNFAAQNETLDVYADKIMADAANRADNSAEKAETTIFLLDQTKNTLQNLTGVNIDEEMTKIIDLEARYQAAATVISTISALFDELIAAVR
jgi:flagellar hook-associated protein 1 FlgK